MRRSANHEPVASVALPVYNGEQYLRDAIDSILGQTLEDLELVLSDNASTDETESICRAYADRDSRVRYFRQERNLGAVPNFNFAFRQTRGRHFKWAAYDDVLEPGYVERCVEALTHAPEATLAHTGVTCIDEVGTELGAFELDRTFAEPRPYDRFRNVMQAYDFSAIWGLMRRDQVARTGLIPSYRGSDRMFLISMLLMGRPVFVDEQLFRWRIHGGSYRNREMTSKAASIAWWSAETRSFPLSTTIQRLVHGSRVLLRSPIPIGERLRCESYFVRLAVSPLIGKLRRRGAAQGTRHGSDRRGIR